ncbi:hypothetical protein [Amycolatopsis sp. CB00013]|uniref:hypothetical protein n=1 Tax=Amycolatopsis sp. CB00013 TaxID=1703945 RepID=UPI001160F49D|nr:hypothetical protein [Amycolatopsis sp. CB00013]
MAEAPPKVDLTPGAPGVEQTGSDAWVVHFKSTKSPDRAGVCRNTFIQPSIVAIGTATAVHYGYKAFCTEPVEYTVTAKIFTNDPGGYLDEAGSVRGAGVSQQPSVLGNSFLCSNNNNNAWTPYAEGQVRGMGFSQSGNPVTVGCTFIG